MNLYLDRFIDSNVLAYAFYDNDKKEKCVKLLKEGGVINTLNLVEAFNIIQFETGNRKHATDSIKSLLKLNFNIVTININLVFEALKRADKYEGLKFIDLIHYTTALMNNCSEIVSYDSDFDDLEIKRTTP